MLALLAHGELGGWDELVIVVVGFVVLWVAVKLAGRKPATREEADEAKEADDPEPAAPAS
jgi:hypothetical protein